MKKLITLLLTVAMLLSMAVIVPAAADVDGDWITLRQANDYPEVDPETGEYKIYAVVDTEGTEDDGTISPHPIVIVEGIHVFARPEVRDLCDLKVFAELDPDVAILRRVKRDMEERGRDLDGITLQYLRTVKPMYERYIRNYKDCVDIVVPTLIHSGVGAEMIYGYVMNHLNDKK